MGYASLSGRARTSASRPQSFAVCDRCAFWFQHSHLRWQFQYAGTSLVNQRLLVCTRCLDRPQAQLKAIMLPADPTPILNSRVEPFALDES